MTQPPRWLTALLFGLATTGCSLNPENGSSRSSVKTGSYVVHGQRYHVLRSADGFVQHGIASWYGRKFHGRRTSSGELYNMYAMTAAHKRLPIPSRVEVTNLTNGRHAVVRINDRGPFVRNRIIDLSYAAAKQLDMLNEGIATVEIRALSARPTQASERHPSAAPQAPAAVPVSAIDAQRDAVFYVQAGAFTDQANAYRLQGQLETGQFTTPIRVEPIQRGRNKYYRVRLGPLRSREAAVRLAQQLADYGVDDAHMVDSP
ncbi:septal ring lytic transglycosylase RlpA family protein [Nitrococcus mobilis]|uniref:Endolytic peptidoglycan transglycosylase RlpA n=1 Tax=Nitrococcus mobilis Nb-231 TaxID=314278 RepID=A4BLX0_9GAMM|nr:septal ring lytic transglycosylase RlpA family protein [Nitrococcus mobilis]EAR23308.1 Rare lipoprotein A [Nitrococcus mobilis Nb-231]